MCACTDIFAKPSITQAHNSAHSPKGKDLHSKAFCVYYIIRDADCQDAFFMLIKDIFVRYGFLIVR